MYNKPKKKKDILRRMKRKLMERLKDLKDVTSDDDQFAYGEKTAYVECLEWLQAEWGEVKSSGLDFDIEKRYPL